MNKIWANVLESDAIKRFIRYYADNVNYIDYSCGIDKTVNHRKRDGTAETCYDALFAGIFESGGDFSETDAFNMECFDKAEDEVYKKQLNSDNSYSYCRELTDSEIAEIIDYGCIHSASDFSSPFPD